MRKRTRDYSMIRYDDLPELREPGKRIRIKSSVVIDFSVFHKTDEEKWQLKKMKRLSKIDKNR